MGLLVELLADFDVFLETSFFVFADLESVLFLDVLVSLLLDKLLDFELFDFDSDFSKSVSRFFSIDETLAFCPVDDFESLIFLSVALVVLALVDLVALDVCFTFFSSFFAFS